MTSFPFPLLLKEKGVKEYVSLNTAPLLQKRGWGEGKRVVSSLISYYNKFMITIRKAIPEDASAIIDFQQKMAWETEHMTLVPDIITKGVRAVFNDPSKGKYWVAENKGMVIASLLITYEWSDWRNCNVWWIQSVYVLSEFRRKGIFRSMYLYIKDEAEKNGIPGLRLYVETNNSPAQNTYEALGMKSLHYKMFEWMKE